MPPTKDIMSRVNLRNNLGEEFELALLIQFIASNKPIVLATTDLVNANPTPITLNFDHCEAIRFPNKSLGQGKGEVSVSDFQEHDKNYSKNIEEAFTPTSKNQIENILDEVYGAGHTAVLTGSGDFDVRRNGVLVVGFKIVYMRGCSGAPNHPRLTSKCQDLLHVTFEEIKEKLFRNIP
ncbi:hypothetical protein BGZ58_003208 [Dissophora ornata]|nr:hypothetical protein BGZ58_003208 [Dissophora ornata]